MFSMLSAVELFYVGKGSNFARCSTYFLMFFNNKADKIYNNI